MSDKAMKLEALIEATFRFVEGKQLTNEEVILIAENQMTGLLHAQKRNAAELAADPTYVLGLLTALVILLGTDEKEKEATVRSALERGARCLHETDLCKSFRAQLEKDMSPEKPTTH